MFSYCIEEIRVTVLLCDCYITECKRTVRLCKHDPLPFSVETSLDIEIDRHIGTFVVEQGVQSKH